MELVISDNHGDFSNIYTFDIDLQSVADKMVGGNFFEVGIKVILITVSQLAHVKDLHTSISETLQRFGNVTEVCRGKIMEIWENY